MALVFVLTSAPVVVPCVPIPEGADDPEVALLDGVPVPAPELAAEPALSPAPPPEPPPPPPPPWANAVEEIATKASATIKGLRIMDGAPGSVDTPRALRRTNPILQKKRPNILIQYRN